LIANWHPRSLGLDASIHSNSRLGWRRDGRFAFDFRNGAEIMNSSSIPGQRNRLIYAVAIVLVIGTGLLLRSHLLPLPAFLVKYGGDALWALVVFLGFGFAFRRSSTAWIAVAAVCFAWTVEFLQLYHAPWIEAIRATRPGRLVLGSSFNGPDLMAYVIGIAVGALAECVSFRGARSAEQKA
jgi:hypothetical protein